MKSFISLLFLVSSIQVFSAVQIQEEAFVVGQGPEIIRDLIVAGSVEVDHVSSKGFEVYGGKGLFKYLESRNIFFLDMNELKNKVLDDYPSFAEITRRLQSAQSKNPNIIKLFSIGKSVKGKDLWMVKISDNVNVDEVEPEFKFISSMHGDEITGRELTIQLIEEIAQNYGKDREITELVNNTEIYIMPSMNPDGSEAKRRANARGIDLNRNFPDILRDRESSTGGREIETLALMKFQGQRQFSFSANFHGGAVVVNYPWDSTIDRHPFDTLVRKFSLGYADRNPEMRNSREFTQGVTNGADWYVVRGGMQDWSYFWFNDLQVTVELSDIKWPSYSEIPGFYKSNRDSMIYYMKQIHHGAGIKFRRKGVSGTVRVLQSSPIRKEMGIYNFKDSEFYKVLPIGEYEFSVREKNSDQTETFSVNVVEDVIHVNGNYFVVN